MLNIFASIARHFIEPVTIGSIIMAASAEYKLDHKIVAAVVWQESSGNKWAYRYEPAFFEKYLAAKDLTHAKDRGITSDSERRLRAFSFGLMQIMGQTARENGFSGFLPELFDTKTNINLGCKILSDNLKMFDGDLKKALSAYNSGAGFVRRNGATLYADKVLAHVNNGNYKKVLA
jgi:soluble lytic murein transglycosylase-like protein